MPGIHSKMRATTTTKATGARNATSRYSWATNCEVDLPGATSTGAAAPLNSRARSHVDELGALLDRVLAFAG